MKNISPKLALVASDKTLDLLVSFLLKCNHFYWGVLKAIKKITDNVIEVQNIQDIKK